MIRNPKYKPRTGLRGRLVPETATHDGRARRAGGRNGSIDANSAPFKSVA